MNHSLQGSTLQELRGAHPVVAAFRVAEEEEATVGAVEEDAEDAEDAAAEATKHPHEQKAAVLADLILRPGHRSGVRHSKT